MNSASPQDTYDHMFGSGATSFDWWLKVRALNHDASALEQPEDWQVEVTADDGNDGTKTVIVDHKLVLKTARYVLANRGRMLTTARGGSYPAWSHALERECSNLVFRGDEADLDAGIADELLQLAVLGEVIYG